MSDTFQLQSRDGAPKLEAQDQIASRYSTPLFRRSNAMLFKTLFLLHSQLNNLPLYQFDTDLIIRRLFGIQIFPHGIFVASDLSILVDIYFLSNRFHHRPLYNNILNIKIITYPNLKPLFLKNCDTVYKFT